MNECVIQIISRIMINVDVSVKNTILVKKDYVWNPATSNYENKKVSSKYYGQFSDYM